MAGFGIPTSMTFHNRRMSAIIIGDKLVLEPLESEWIIAGRTRIAEELDVTVDENWPSPDLLEAAQNLEWLNSTQHWAVVHVLDRTAIGGVGVTGAGTETPKIGYDIVEGYRLRGHATEAVRLLSDYLLSQFKGAIFADTLRDNMGSAKVLMNNAFSIESEFEEEGQAMIGWKKQ